MHTVYISRRFLVGPIPAFVLITCAMATKTLAPALGNDPPARQVFKVATDGDALLLPVTINGKQYSFLVDTCASSNLLDPALTRHLVPLKKRARINGLALGQMYSMRGARVGAVALNDESEGARIDLSGFRDSSGHDIYGFLGMPFLLDQVVQVDFERGELTLLKTAPHDAGNAFDISYDKLGALMMNIRFAGAESTAFYVDTGAISVGCSLELLREDIDRFDRRSSFVPSPIVSWVQTVNGREQSRQGWLHELPISGFRQNWVGIGEGPRRAVGLYFLSKYLVTFDFPNKRLYLRTTKRSPDADPLDASGLHFVRRAGRTIIDGVDPKSPADAAGIVVGDQIRTIDGKESTTTSLYQLRVLLASDGRKLRLVTEGTKGPREVELQLPRQKRPLASPVYQER